ncbi:MAG: PD40 domain-containing protein [Anaerolineae bacterium]|nr:PD40 domain-containing protein [Anaerolineae bacterium]
MRGRAVTFPARIGSLLLIVLLAACSLSTGPDDTPAAHDTPAVPTPDTDSAPLVIAWAQRGDLMTWRSDHPELRRIASGAVIRPFVSPDGSLIAYLRGPGGDPQSLWISDTPGANERQLIDAAQLSTGDAVRRLSQIVWAADSRSLYVNTQIGQGIDTRPADDLWHVNAETGAVERLLFDGEGGQIIPSPDGARLALAAAGTYGSTPGSIVFYDLVTRQRVTALEFPAVATASETRWHAALRWMPDSSGISAAIPPPDLVYGGAGASQTALWWLPVDSEPVQIGTADADFFGLPVFSANGAWIAYIQRRQDPQQTNLSLVIARRDGSDPTLYAEGDIGSLALPGWLPDGSRFVYVNGAPGEMWIGEPGAAPVRFPAETVLVSDLAWADALTYVFCAQADDTFTLNVGFLNVAHSAQPIASLDVYPLFDAVHP